MQVLSIDVDFFVDPVAHSMPVGGEERLDGSEYAIDAPAIVESFLDRCGLSTSAPIPGVFIRHHHQAFDVLATLCGAERMASLTHVDAHSDLGMGDCGYVYIATELAHVPASDRRTPRRSDTELNEANWLAFAVAAGWVDRVIFVPRVMPTAMNHDLHPWHVNDARDQITIRRATLAEQKSITLGQRALFARLPVVEAVSLDIQRAATFKAASPPDFVIICQSPQFTPRTADRVLEQCRARVSLDPHQEKIEGPLGWSCA